MSLTCLGKFISWHFRLRCCIVGKLEKNVHFLLGNQKLNSATKSNAIKHMQQVEKNIILELFLSGFNLVFILSYFSYFITIINSWEKEDWWRQTSKAFNKIFFKLSDQQMMNNQHSTSPQIQMLSLFFQFFVVDIRMKCQMSCRFYKHTMSVPYIHSFSYLVRLRGHNFSV